MAKRKVALNQEALNTSIETTNTSAEVKTKKGKAEKPAPVVSSAEEKPAPVVDAEREALKAAIAVAKAAWEKVPVAQRDLKYSRAAVLRKAEDALHAYEEQRRRERDAARSVSDAAAKAVSDKAMADFCTDAVIASVFDYELRAAGLTPREGEIAAAWSAAFSAVHAEWSGHYAGLGAADRRLMFAPTFKAKVAKALKAGILAARAAAEKAEREAAKAVRPAVVVYSEYEKQLHRAEKALADLLEVGRGLREEATRVVGVEAVTAFNARVSDVSARIKAAREYVETVKADEAARLASAAKRDAVVAEKQALLSELDGLLG